MEMNNVWRRQTRKLVYNMIAERPCRWKDLQKNIVGVSTATLHRYLQEFEKNGFIEKRLFGKRPFYLITKKTYTEFKKTLPVPQRNITITLCKKCYGNLLDMETHNRDMLKASMETLQKGIILCNQCSIVCYRKRDKKEVNE